MNGHGLGRAGLLLGLGLAGLLLGACLLAPRPLGSRENPVKMAIVPFLETQRLTVGMRKIADYLERETGYAITSEVPTSYVAVVEGMCAEKVDIGWVSPLAYILASKKCGATMELVSVSRGGATAYRGLIVTRSDSDIHDLADLQGKRFAWVDPGSTSGYLYPRALLLEKGLHPDKVFRQQVFAGGHDKVIVAIMGGQVDAGAVYDDVRTTKGIRDLYPNIMTATRVIARTDAIPNDGVAFRRGLPREMVEKIKAALLKLSGTPEGQALFQEAIGTEGVKETTDAAYDPVRRAAAVLNLDLEAELAKPK
jgi:phosphonate transport system substrate-binding protein